MMKKRFRSDAPGLILLALTFLATSALAQVPQDMTYTGRLVDGLGDPLAGPVDLRLRIFDAMEGGTVLYVESHGAVSLDATGGFSVQLGLGANPTGTFGAALFSDGDRWLEAEVNSEVLTPRQIIGSVPWAFIAQQANEIVPDPNAPRFEDCGDGTVADHQTGLQWEKKTGTLGSAIVCETAGCPDPHIVNNVYPWSNLGTDPDGGAFTDFLARLNAKFDPFNPTGCFANHCDWGLPEISELQTIMIGPDAAPGQTTTCTTAPCIDPGFAAVGGPTGNFGYWSASAYTDNPTLAFTWFAHFSNGTAQVGARTSDGRVRAVRTGSCN